jgi:pimeloyl-ACP methyl ester carboxylesterase
MHYLAQAGFDVFAVDMLGYGRSDRPAPMDDPCNIDPASQAALIPSPLADVCPASYIGDVATIGSDRDDIDAVVDYLKRLVKYVATGGVMLGAKLMHDDFLTGDRQGAPGPVHQ